MPERDGYIPGVPCALDATQPDPEAAVAFYSGLFGWECEDVMPLESEARYFVARLRGHDVAAVGSIEVPPQTATWNTYFWVDNADETASRVREAGGSVLMEPFDIEPEAGRKAVCTDLEGAVFCVWQAKKNTGAQLVNEPGTLVFNGLHTRDMEGAKSFYGPVFGWRTFTLDGGAEMWALPGYGDHLERDNPDHRKRLTEMGGPGYDDVVASIDPIPDDQPDPPAQWSVTFAVDDPNATAAKATELGGTVIDPPLEAPWSRPGYYRVHLTILKDPQGATFGASKFVPENKALDS
jgi:predicted enzyme related to lactoylglutathione lyase